MSTSLAELPAFPKQWKRRHLLDLESLTREELVTLLDVATELKQLTQGCRQKLPLLTAKRLQICFSKTPLAPGPVFHLPHDD